MKLNRIILLLFVVLTFQKLFTQELSEDQKKWIIKEISYSDTVFGWYQIVDSGLARAVRYQITEAIPTIETELWRRSIGWGIKHLNALYKLNDPNAHNITLAYFDSLEIKNYDDGYKLEERVEANKILMKFNDYTKINYIFLALENNNDWLTFSLALSQLPEIIKNVPSQASRAKGILESTVSKAEKADERLDALSLLEQIYGFSVFPYMKKIFIEDKDESNRLTVLYNYMKKYKNEEVNKFLKERYPYEKRNRDRIADILLYDYGRLSDYKFLWDFNQTETDPKAKRKLETVLYVYGIMSLYISTHSESSTPAIPVVSMLDSLFSFNKQCTSYNWIDNNLSSEVNSKIQNAKTYLNRGDSINCAKQISALNQKVKFECKDTFNITNSFITIDGYNFLYYYSKQILYYLPAVPAMFNLNINLNGNGTVDKSPSQTEYDSSSTVTLTAKPSPGYIFKEWTGDITGTNAATSVVMNSNKNITAVFIPAPSGAKIKLINSSGALLTGGTLQYYEGSWKDAINNNDGTFTVNTTKTTLSLRMTYEYGSQTKQNVPVGNGEIVFQTVNTQVKLQNSNGSILDHGTVQYYAGAWRTFGNTSGGVASKELLPGNYSFRMTYAFASKDLQQDLSVNPVVTFRTVKAQVQLKNSQGNLIDQGTVQYYAGAWRDFGVTSNGTASLELLPNNYSFRMTYAFASTDKQQDLGTNPTIVFQTVNAAVQLQNSQGTLIDQGAVQYYSGAWRDFGTTTNGIANKEMLPNNYSFRMTYEYSSTDKQQNLADNPTVVFKTVNAQVQLKNSLGSLINDQAAVQYYAGAWRTFGNTTGGVASKELLPGKYSFRMTYAFASKDLQQDLVTNPVVTFQTVKALVQLKNSQSTLIDQGTVQYYSSAWRTFGVTNNGTASLELLPNNYSFRMTYEYVSIDKQQDLSSNSTVSFSTVLCTVRVKDASSQPVNSAQVSYYSGAWRLIGSTINGEITKELLPAELSFRAKLGTKQTDVKQNIANNNIVEIALP